MSTQIETGETSLTATRVFDAPRDLVFAAWTVPEHIKAWGGCPGGTLLEVSVDLRVGGEYRNRMRIEGVGEVTLVGAFTEVDVPRRIVYTMGPDPAMEGESFPTSTVTIDFIAKGQQTEVRLHHSGLVTDEMRGGVNEGWQNGFEKLVGYLEEQQAAA